MAAGSGQFRSVLSEPFRALHIRTRTVLMDGRTGPYRIIALAQVGSTTVQVAQASNKQQNSGPSVRTR